MVMNVAIAIIMVLFCIFIILSGFCCCADAFANINKNTDFMLVKIKKLTPFLRKLAFRDANVMFSTIILFM